MSLPSIHQNNRSLKDLFFYFRFFGLFILIILISFFFLFGIKKPQEQPKEARAVAGTIQIAGKNRYKISRTFNNTGVGDCINIGTLNATGDATETKVKAWAHYNNQLFLQEWELSATYYTGSTIGWVEVPPLTGTSWNDSQNFALDAQFASFGPVVGLRLRRLSGGGAAGTINVEVESNATLTEDSTAAVGCTVASGYLGRLGGYKFPVTTNHFAAAGSEGLYILGNGNVGIGTVSPGYKLEVAGGSLALTGSSGDLLVSANDTSPSNLATITSEVGGLSLRLKARSGDNPDLVVATTGNVGIGTASPGQKLDVAGNVQASVYYDRDNTSRYSDPNGDSYLERAFFYGNGGAIWGPLWVWNDGTFPGIKADFSGCGSCDSTIRMRRRIEIWNGTGGSAYLDVRNSIGSTTVMLDAAATGRISIGGTMSTYQLELTENSAAKPTSSAWTVPSDRRVKENITSFLDGLSVLKQINPINYTLNGKAGTPKGLSGISVIAQEVKDIIPYTISTYKAKLNPDDKEETELYNFDSSSLTFVTINAVKELNTKIENQQKQIEELKVKNTQLEEQMKKLEEKLNNAN